MMERQNVTLSLPKDVLKQAKHIAVDKGVSLSGLLTDCLEDLVRDTASYEQAKKQALKHMNRKYDLGRKGAGALSRDSLHER
jgi:hypothetical protein